MGKQLIYRNIFGKKVKLDEPYSNNKYPNIHTVKDALDKALEGGNGVINVESLPATSEAEEGAIYYNTETGIHYLFDGANFTEINTSVMPVVRKTGTSTALQYGVSIQPNCYNIITIPLAASVEAKPFVFNFVDVPEATMAGQYVGRFTALADNQAISLYTDTTGVSLHWPNDVPDIVEGHTYEFNLLYDTCLLTDITVTSQSEDEPAPAEPTN